MTSNQRTKLRVAIGSRVLHQGRIYEIRNIIDMKQVLARDLESGGNKVLEISDLSPIADGSSVFHELDEIDPKDLEIARFRMDAIRPLLKPGVGRIQIEQHAQKLGVHFTTLYRWLRRYEAAGTLEALLPQKRGRRQGTRRLSDDVETIIQEVIETVFLTRQRSPAQKVVLEVRRRCLDAGLEPPHANTIRKRIQAIPMNHQLRRRGQKKVAEARYSPAPGKFPGADYPLAYVQIDHTPVDLVLVDEEYRLPIGRPWITLAIDVYSRMVAGLHVSFDAPSETSVAMCVAHSVLPKEDWLRLLELDLEWPTYGLMDTIHVDNGAEFRSSNFRDACALNGINLEYRPVRQPRFGGHIERMLGTLLKEIHDLPGTTFSSVKDRGEYQPHKHASMTLKEFEVWLVTLICKVYHQRVHSSIGMPPIRKWEIGIFGDGREVQGRGLPEMPSDYQVFQLDFLPRFHRTVQPTGVTIDGLTYYADVLRNWIGALDPDNRKMKRKFIFRRDPRDISLVWFFDPDMREYFRVPFANQALPSMSIWEYRKARVRAQEEGMKGVDERRLLDALEELREQARKSAASTKKARREQQKRRDHKERAVTVQPKRSEQSPPAESLVDDLPVGEDGVIDVDGPLGEIA